MKSLVQIIRRAVAWHQVRSLEIALQGQSDAMQSIKCPYTRDCIAAARSITERDLAKARSDYGAMLPVGKRITYEVA